jgi:hypothetical protein
VSQIRHQCRTSRRRRRQRLGLLNPTLARLLAIEVEGDRASLSDPPAVVAELHSHLVVSRRDLRGSRDGVAVQAEEVVAVSWLAVLGVEGPAAGQPL